MEAWQNIPTPLRVAGSGPLQHLVTAAKEHGVTELGLLDSEAVYQEMRRARFLVFSSIWYECFPLTFIDAFAAGLPIIAAKLGAVEDIITHGETGLHFKPGDAASLAEAVAWAEGHYRCEAMSMADRRQATEQDVDENNAAMFVDRDVMNIDIAGDVGYLRHIEAIKAVALLPGRQHILKLPGLIKRAQIH